MRAFLWYQFGPYEAYFNIGRYDDVMSLVDINLASSQGYVEETYYWQGRVLAAQGETQQAAYSFNTALTHNPLYTAAQDALQELNA